MSVAFVSANAHAHPTETSTSNLSAQLTSKVKPLTIQLIADNVYMHTSYKHIQGYGLVDSNGLIVVEGNTAYIIDTPWSEQDTQTLLNWAHKKGLSIAASLSTHWHEDRTKGIALLNQKGVATYTSTMTAEFLKQNNKPLPLNTFAGEHFILKEKLIEAYYPGPGHAKDNIVVWLPQQQMLFGGCLVRALAWHSLGNLSDADVSQWAKSVAKLIAHYPQAKIVIPGHGRIADASMLKHTIDIVNKSRE